jgi:hypothetical protein
MKHDPLKSLRASMQVAPDTIAPARQAAHFGKAQDVLRKSVARLEAAGISNETIVAAMLTETLPRMVYENGAAWASMTLAKLAHSLDVSGSAAGPRH